MNLAGLGGGGGIWWDWGEFCRIGGGGEIRWGDSVIMGNLAGLRRLGGSLYDLKIAKTDRFAFYKVGPVLSISVGAYI